MTIEAKVSEADVMRIKPGQEVYFTVLGAPDRRFYSKLRAVEPAPESLARPSSSGSNLSSSANSANTAVYYNGLFDVSNPHSDLRTSMTAQVTIVQAKVNDVLAIPVTALGKRQSDGRYSVRILGDKGEPQERLIQTGLSDKVHVQVVTGLTVNDKVIIDVNIGNPSDDSASSTEQP